VQCLPSVANVWLGALQPTNEGIVSHLFSSNSSISFNLSCRTQSRQKNQCWRSDLQMRILQLIDLNKPKVNKKGTHSTCDMDFE